MKILFIFDIENFNNMFILFYNFSYIIENNLLYIILTSIIVFGLSGLSHINYSKITEGLKNVVKIVGAGGAAKAGSDLYDYGKEKIKEIIDGKKNSGDGSASSTSSNPTGNTSESSTGNTSDSTNTSTSDSTNTKGKQ